MKGEVEQGVLFDLAIWDGKTSPAAFPAESRQPTTSGSFWRKPAESPYQDYLSLDLRADAGYIVERSWQTLFPWLGGYWTPVTGACPHIWKEIALNPVPRNGVGASFLSQILQDSAPPKYYLSAAACLGILRRAAERGKELPLELDKALRWQAGVGDYLGANAPLAFATNQRDEVRDLGDTSAALCSQPGMKQQTFVAAGFCAGAAPTAGNISYEKEIAPTMKAGGSGTNMVPTILCLNDQGGQRMDLSREVAGTLRAQMDGHPPLVMDEEAYCIMGNAIDRQPHNGGNGIGVQADIAYTMTATERPAVFSRQRVDAFKEDDIASTQATRQYKDATDLVCQPYQETVGAITRSDHHGIGSQYVSQDKCIVEPRNLIRRLTPLEGERLQGFPDGWTDIPGASDSARYKALGNSVAIPCVEFIMGGIAEYLRNENEQ